MNDTNKRNGLCRSISQSLIVTLILMLLCGFAFPVVLSAISAVIFPSQAKGDLVYADGQPVGSAHVGQDFTKDYFMHGRPSAYAYNTFTENEEGQLVYNDGSEFAGLSSGSDNYAPSDLALSQRVEADIEAFLEAHPCLSREDIPTDLMTASGSGLDPHISPASASIQIPYIAKASGLSVEQLESIVESNTSGKLLGVFGEETVNVLGVNLDIAQAMGLVEEVQH